MKLRESKGSAYERRNEIFMRVTVAPQKRRSELLRWVTLEHWDSVHDRDADACPCVACGRARAVQALVNQLRRADKTDFVEKVIEVGARQDADLAELAAAVAGIVGGAIVSAAPPSDVLTFKQFAEQWTDGELHKLYPDSVRLKRSADEDAGRLALYVYPIVGDTPLADFTLKMAQDVLRSIPSERSTSTRRQVAQVMVRVCNLAVYPCEKLKASPLPKGFLPRVKCRLGSHLYPEEDRALLACAGSQDKPGIPLANRLLYGFLAREGLRKDEALSLTWADLDLKRGAVRLDRNKTDDPRAWAMDPGVAAALRWWRKRYKQAPDGAHVFVDVERTDHLAAELRKHMVMASVTRAELFESSDVRRRLDVHSLRSTFVTVSLANGKSEAFVQDRSGHKSSVMVNRYRRVARTAAELGLGTLTPLHLALPEAAAEHGGEAPEPPATSSNGAASAGTFVEPATIAVSKSGERASVPRVRIPCSPQRFTKRRGGATAARV